MPTSMNAIRKVLDAAIDGGGPDRKGLREAGVRREDDSTVGRLAQLVAGIAQQDTDAAKRYRDHAVTTLKEADEAATNVADTPASGVGIRTDHSGKKREDHPAMYVLDQVANGRQAPTVEHLKQAGFPDDLAKQTHAEARVVQAAAKTGPGNGRRVGRELGNRLAHDTPWPDPEDTWNDLDGVVPSDQEEAGDPDEIAAKILARKQGP